MLRANAASLASLQRVFSDLAGRDAIALLCNTFDAINSVVYIDSLRFTVRDLYDDYAIRDSRADDIEIRFFGGAPGSGRWFSGTLLTLLLDHALYCLASNHPQKVIDAIKWVSRNRQLV